ncbi:hypothetical protein V9T40_006586 [Parthenolecanium corni]|uniref:PDZ domain-containing protein n=1 Tax=Parthenolecanium corni TaxID=536013 RepID=A0AAN9TKD1_9HEMI
MAQLLTFRLARTDSTQSWGFRLQGGKDFGTPLLIQKVNCESLAEKAGLRVGDALIRVNNVEVAEQRHKDAQDVIIGAGNAFDVTVQRGGLVTWKPSVSPVGSIPSPNPHIAGSPVPVTKTSLAATYKPGSRPPHGFNSASKPFSPQLNGGGGGGGGHEAENGPVKAIVNKQYNSPVGIYSDESIAETLSAQAEVLAGGVLGVNFKKNEKNYNSEGSEVFKMLREAESERKWPEPAVRGSKTETDYRFDGDLAHGRTRGPNRTTRMKLALALSASAATVSAIWPFVQNNSFDISSRRSLFIEPPAVAERRAAVAES